MSRYGKNYAPDGAGISNSCRSINISLLTERSKRSLIPHQCPSRFSERWFQISRLRRALATASVFECTCSFW